MLTIVITIIIITTIIIIIVIIVIVIIIIIIIIIIKLKKQRYNGDPLTPPAINAEQWCKPVFRLLAACLCLSTSYACHTCSTLSATTSSVHRCMLGEMP